jgi:hypothetical protein
VEVLSGDEAFWMEHDEKSDDELEKSEDVGAQEIG